MSALATTTTTLVENTAMTVEVVTDFFGIGPLTHLVVAVIVILASSATCVIQRFLVWLKHRAVAEKETQTSDPVTVHQFLSGRTFHFAPQDGKCFHLTSKCCGLNRSISTGTEIRPIELCGHCRRYV